MTSPHSETSPLPSTGLCPALQGRMAFKPMTTCRQIQNMLCLCCPCCICPSKVFSVFLDELCTLFLLTRSDDNEVSSNKKKQLPANPKSRSFYKKVRCPFCGCVFERSSTAVKSVRSHLIISTKMNKSPDEHGTPLNIQTI